jgi:hypothetical protein
VHYLAVLSDEVLIHLASLCSKNKFMFAPGEKIFEKQTLCLIINNGQVRALVFQSCRHSLRDYLQIALFCPFNGFIRSE